MGKNIAPNVIKLYNYFFAHPELDIICVYQAELDFGRRIEYARDGDDVFPPVTIYDFADKFVANGKYSETDAVKLVSDVLGIEYVDLDNIHVDEEMSELLPKNLAFKYRCMVIYEDEREAAVVSSAPDDPLMYDDVRFCKRKKLKLLLATKSAMDRALYCVYGYNEGLKL